MFGMKPCLLLVAFTIPAWSQGTQSWRLWTTADGLRESYTPKIAIGGGGFWAKHGDVEKLSKLDGYSVRGIPDPGTIGPLAAAPDGDLWTIGRTTLRRYRGGKWAIYEVPELRALRLDKDTDQNWRLSIGSKNRAYAASMYPLGKGRVLLLIPDAVLLFDSDHRASRTVLLAANTRLKQFNGMYEGASGRIWVSGNQGIGFLHIGNPADSVLRFEWTDRAGPPGFSKFQELYEGDNGEAIVTGSRMGAKSVLRLDRPGWKVLYTTSSDRLRGWPGMDGEIWVQDGDSVKLLSGTKGGENEHAEAVAGRIMGVTKEPGGSFWLATSHGVARYTPPVWRTPRALNGRDLDSMAIGMAEDNSGTLWFLYHKALVRFQANASKIYPLPHDMRSSDVLTDTIRALPDGRLAVITEASREMLIFDPVREKFTRIRHPEGRILRMFASSQARGLLVQAVVPGNPAASRLDAFDGAAFHPFLEIRQEWKISDLRSVCETASHEIWLGGTSTLGIYRDGVYRPVNKSDGYEENGAFYIHSTTSGHVIVGGRDMIGEFDGSGWKVLQKGIDRVRSIIESRDGTVWSASGTGVHRWTSGRWITNGTEEGLPSSRVYRVFEDSRGRIWAGTSRGVALMHPEADTDPPLTIINEENNAREIAPGAQVSLFFSGIDRFKFTPPERLLFSYRMDGGVWSPFTENSSARFRSLPRGLHRFEVRAMDRNGNVDRRGAGFEFKVQMPWYQNAEFRIAAIVTALIFTLLLIGQSHRRGKLILELRNARKVESTKKAILEMIARREPLTSILGAIARGVEENEPGCSCRVLTSGHADMPRPEEMPEPGYIANNRDIAITGAHGNQVGVMEVRGERVPATLQGAEVISVMVALASGAIENARMYEQLRNQAKFDELTGALNRRYFRDLVEHAITSPDAPRRKPALVCIDVDRFKQLNDSLGHMAGDELLRELAGRISAFLSAEGAVGRMGGDEFTVLIAETSGAETMALAAQHLLDALKKPLMIDGGKIFPSVSMGISVFPENGTDFATLHKTADCALYRAKQLGKGRFERFSGESNAPFGIMLEVETDLRRALEQNWFELHYQPQFTINGEIKGVEALIRLRHPERGLIPPGSFIPVAEDCGLIIEIGDWTLREACRQRVEWNRLGYAKFKLGVNVSARQFARSDFAQSVSAILTEYGLPGSAIEIELTERVILTNIEAAVEQMNNLRALGLSVAIDDFGTGYSSLSYLHRLPIDVLKLDQSFVRAMDRDAKGLQLARSIVSLAHNLALTTIAEGVERQLEHDYLRKIGCDLAQGYLMARPVPAHELDALLQTTIESRARNGTPVFSHILTPAMAEAEPACAL